jgi:hypothetical protein
MPWALRSHAGADLVKDESLLTETQFHGTILSYLLGRTAARADISESTDTMVSKHQDNPVRSAQAPRLAHRFCC